MTVTEYFTRLQGKRVLVLGLGVSNRPLVRLLLRFGIDVTGCDRGRSSTRRCSSWSASARGCTSAMII